MAILHESPEQKRDEQLFTVREDRVADFLKDLNRAHFWEMPTESQHRGLDGAEWILESARYLLQLAGQEHRGGC
jgi:hypothetical protein